MINYIHLQIIIMLLLLFAKLQIAYKTHTLADLCPTNELKKVYQSLTDTKPKIKLETEDESAVIVHQRWNSSTFKRFRECSFKVDVGNDKQNANRRGLYAHLQSVRLRREPESQDCIDYFIFKFGNDASKKICGEYGTESNDNSLKFFDDPGGVIKVYIKLDTFKPLTDIDDSLEISFVFTAYGVCTTIPPTLMCVPGEERSCIASDFKNDSIHNCPPPYCADEYECPTKRPQITKLSKSNIILTAVTSLVITMFIVSGCLWLCWRFYFTDNRRNDNNNNNNNNNNDTINSLSLVTPMALGDADIELRPPSSNRQQNSTTIGSVAANGGGGGGGGSQPIIVEKDLPPSYESLFPISS